MKVKVKCNIWGNWNCFEGVTKTEFGRSQRDAIEWLSQKLLAGGCELSKASDVSMADVEAHRAKEAAQDAWHAERAKRRG